jgi:flavin-dependent dehydrogenase
VSNAVCDEDAVKLFVGTNVAPGFFAWIIPAGDAVRVGLCTQRNAGRYLERFASSNDHAKTYLEDAKLVTSLAGSIPMGPIEKTFGDRVMIVGDAAAQVKPTSGGGIYPGLVCANHCAKTVIEALERNDFSERFLSRYHKRWTGDIGKELRKDWRLYKLFQSFSDEKMEEAFKLLDNPKILRLIEDRGDIDYPSKLALPLVRKEPRLLKFATKSLLDFLLG